MRTTLTRVTYTTATNQCFGKQIGAIINNVALTGFFGLETSIVKENISQAGKLLQSLRSTQWNSFITFIVLSLESCFTLQRD